jgi:hypothetical protein
VIVKDFFLEKDATAGKTTGAPRRRDGELRLLQPAQEIGYSRPISQHYEYNVGAGPQMIAHLQHDLKVLREVVG